MSARSFWVCARIEASVLCAWGVPFCLKGYHPAFSVDHLCPPQQRCFKRFAKSPLCDVTREVIGHLKWCLEFFLLNVHYCDLHVCLCSAALFAPNQSFSSLSLKQCKRFGPIQRKAPWGLCVEKTLVAQTTSIRFKAESRHSVDRRYRLSLCLNLQFGPYQGHLIHRPAVTQLPLQMGSVVILSRYHSSHLHPLAFHLHPQNFPLWLELLYHFQLPSQRD